jgi:hypothetical protein
LSRSNSSPSASEISIYAGDSLDGDSDVDEYFNAIGARLGHYETSDEYNYPDSIDVEFIPSLNPAL